jgi:hypothetical protein
MITSAVDATDLYTVDMKTLAAKAVKADKPWRTSDLANSNILRTKGPVALPELISATTTVNDKIQLYPNPVTGNQFNIQFTDADAGNYTIQVTDARGQMATQKRITIGGKGNVTSISLTKSAAKGIYVVKVTDNNSKVVYSNKIIVQ